MGTLASELQPLASALSDAPRIYADANLPAGLVGFMRQELGWDVLFVVEHDDLRRARDTEHYQRALDFGRTVVTLDRDFFDDRRFPPEHSPGVIVFSAPNEAGLRRLLVHVDRALLRTRTADLPLKGRKLEITPGDLPADQLS